MRFFTPLLVVLLGTPAMADENTDAARDFVVTCGQRLPETKQTVQILKDDGWRYEASDGAYHFYSQNGRRVIAATTVTSAPQQGCLAAVSRLTDAGAIAVGNSAAKALGLQPLPEANEPGALAIWAGTINGHNIAMAAIPSHNYGFFRGASVVLVQE